MSLILDALHRAGQDKNTVPGLTTHHPVEQLPVERRQFIVWVILAVALVVIAWLLMERFSAPPPAADIGAPVAELSNNIGSAVTSVTTELKARAAAAPPAPPAPQAAVVAPQPVVAAPAPVATPVSAETNPPAPVPQPMTAAPSPVQELAAPAEATPALAEEDKDAVAELYQNRELQKDPVMPKPAARAESRTEQGSARDASAGTGTSKVARSEQSDDLDKILEQAREELENASLDDHPVPFLSSLSQQTKDDIPTLYYQRHDYSSDTKVSSVVLNGTTVKTGGSPLPGMKVEEILPDSVVLNYRGTQFRLRALNSWVNL